MDGREDLVLFENPGLNPGYVLQLLINRSGSGFRDETNERLPDQINQSTGMPPPGFRVGDLDGDGRLELLVQTFGKDFDPANKLTDFFLNDGCGIFRRLPPSAFKNVGVIFVPVDANGDDFTDFVFGEFRSDEMELFLVMAKPKGPAAEAMECPRTEFEFFVPIIDLLFRDD